MSTCLLENGDLFKEIRKIRKSNPTVANVIDGVCEDIPSYFANVIDVVCEDIPSYFANAIDGVYEDIPSYFVMTAKIYP